MIEETSLHAEERFALHSKTPDRRSQGDQVSPLARAVAPTPRGTRRRSQLLDVAERVFVVKGFVETTMQDVAREAGASKETLYRHFGSKKALFAELINVRIQYLHGRLNALMSDQGSIATTLRHLGISFVDVLTSPEMVSLSKMISSEAYRDSSIQRLVYSAALSDLIEILSEQLAVAKCNSTFAGRDTELCARIFLGALLSFSQFPELFLDGRTSPTRREIDRTVDEVVLMFTGAYVALNSSV